MTLITGDQVTICGDEQVVVIPDRAAALVVNAAQRAALDGRRDAVVSPRSSSASQAGPSGEAGTALSSQAADQRRPPAGP